jgi:hypothetical protein
MCVVADSDKLVRNHLPVASLARLNELGMDPSKYGSCSQRKNGNIGCTYFATCPFGRAWGNVPAFKGTRPHNLGYYVKPLEGPAKIDWMPCFAFLAGLYNRMKHGIFEASEGRKAEKIRVIAKEGDEIPYKVTRSADPNCNKSRDSRLVTETIKIRVPEFPDPLAADPELAHEMEIERSFPVDLAGFTPEGVADAAEVSELMKEVGGETAPPDGALPKPKAVERKNG